VEVDNGDAMVQLAMAGHGIVRIGRFHVENDIQAGHLITLLDDFDVCERETFHPVFVGGPNLPERVGAFVDFVSDPDHH
jgi:DNA-binding transcriptional LysR family regulator